MSPVDWIATLALPLGLGELLLRWMGLRVRDDALAWLGWSWVVGASATGAVVFLLCWSGTDLSHPGWPRAALLLAGAACALAIRRRLGGEDAEPVAPPGTELQAAAPSVPLWERVVFWAATAFVLATTLARILTGSLRPIVEDDEAHFWARKAQLLFASGGFTDAFRAATADPTALYNADYPVLNPMLQLWVFANAGEITHVANRLPIQLFAVALVLVLAAALRRATRPLIAALLLVAFAACFELRAQSMRAHGDLMVALAALVAGDAWLRWRREGGTPWLRLSAVAVAMLLASKNEGQVFLLAALGAGAFACVVTRRLPRVPRQAWRWALLPVAVFALHVSVNASFGFENGFLAGAERDASLAGLIVSQFAERAPVVLGFYVNEIALDPTHSNLVLPCLFVLLIASPFVLGRDGTPLPALVILIFLAGQMLIFVGAPHSLEWHLQTAARRIAFQAVPLAFLWVGAVAGWMGTSTARGAPFAGRNDQGPAGRGSSRSSSAAVESGGDSAPG